MTVYFLSDLHFGVRNASHEWLDNQLKYFYNFFLKNVTTPKEQSVLIISGDLFDNRQSINIFILNNALKLFGDLSKVFKEIHIITGNHDISNKTNNEINSLMPLSFIENVKVYTKPELVRIGVKKFLMMPWSNFKEHIYIQDFTNHEPDYLVMHSNIASLRFNKYVEMQEGVDVQRLSSFKRVFNGHIHYNQEKKNIVMLGSPYHLSRNDLENTKYMYILDVESDKLTKIENTYSPRFIQIDLYDLIEYTMPEAKKLFDNNYVYLKISNRISFDSTINEILAQLHNSKNTKILYYDEEVEEINELNYDSNLSIENIIDEYIADSEHEPKVKKQISSIIAQYKQNITVTDLIE